MPNPKTTDGCLFARDNLAALALGALDGADRAEVEHHLRWCERCRSEADDYDQVANLLPLALAPVAEPSPALRSALFERIARDDEAQPAVQTATSLPPSPGPATATAAASAPQGWWRYVPAAAVAPLAIALLVVSTWANSLRNDLDNQPPTIVPAADMTLSGGEMQMYAVERTCDTCAGTAQLGLSEVDGMGMMVAWNFDPSQEHQVWGVTESGEMKKVCELYVNPAGSVMQTFSLPEPPSGLTDIAITDPDGNLIYVAHLVTTPVVTPGPAESPAAIH
jgi:hypothetical protein